MNKTMIIIFGALVTFFSCISEPRSSITVSNPQAIDSVLNYFVNEGYYPGLYARVEDKHGNVIYEHSTVNQAVLPDVELDEHSWFRIWSMSKIVTISTVLDLVEDGLLKSG